MPYADVSDIIGRRDPVAEAQKWKQLKLQEKELEQKLAESKKKNQPKPYDYSYDASSYASENPYQQELFNSLADEHQNMTYADMDYLVVDPAYADGTTRQKHLNLEKRTQFAQRLNVFADKAKSIDDDLVKKIAENPAKYDNQENRDLLARLRKDWTMGHNWRFDENSNGVIEQKIPVQVPIVENGKPKYKKANGQGTTFNADEALMENGNPVPATVASETEFDTKLIGMNEWWGSQGFDKIVENKGKDAFSWEQYFDDIVTTDNGELDHENSYNLLEPHLFGKHGWDDKVGDGSLPYHSAVIEDWMRTMEDEGGNRIYANKPLTKADILKYIAENAYKSKMEKQKLSLQQKQASKDLDQKIKSDEQEKLDLKLKEELSNGNYNISSFEVVGDSQISPQEGWKYEEEQWKSDWGTALALSGEYEKTSFTFDDSDVTLLRGNNKFKNSDAFSGKGESRQFVFSGVANFRYYDGEFISDTMYEALSDEEKAKVIWKTGVKGSFVANDDTEQQVWGSLGYVVGEDNTVDAIIDIDKLYDDATKDPNTRTNNKRKIELLKERAKALNEEGAKEQPGGSGDTETQYEGDSIFQ